MERSSEPTSKIKESKKRKGVGNEKSPERKKKKRTPLIPEYKIPKEKFDRALEILELTKWNVSPEWEMTCHTPVHAIHERKHELVKNIYTRLLEQARLCLLQRNWKNLAKVLSTAKPIAVTDSKLFFPQFLKYAAICLKHNKDVELLKKYLHGVLSFEESSEEEQFWKSLTSIQ